MSVINQDNGADPAITTRPGNPKVTHETPTSARISWTPIPVDHQNEIITGYTVQIVGPDLNFIEEVSADCVSIELSDLIPFTSYTVKVSAKTKAGCGPPASTSFVTPEGAPSGSPGELVVSHGYRSWTTKVSWTPVPREKQNGVITGYTVQIIDPSNGSVIHTQKVKAYVTSCEVHNMIISHSAVYVFKVSAKTKAGTGPPTEKQYKTPDRNYRRGFSRLGMGTIVFLFILSVIFVCSHEVFLDRLVVTRGSVPTSVCLSWQPPPLTTIQNGAIITGYVIVVMGSSNELLQKQHVRSNVTSIEIFGLKHSTTYVFKVMALTYFGCGPPASITFEIAEQESHSPNLGFFLLVVAIAIVGTINSLGSIENNSMTSSSQEFTYCQVNNPSHRANCSLQEFKQIHNLTKVEDFYKLRRSVQDIGDWQSLCRNVEVSIAVMDRLVKNDRDHPKDECLEYYIKSDKAYWEEVVIAVARPPLNNRRLAKKIAEKYLPSPNNVIIMSMLNDCKTFDW